MASTSIENKNISNIESGNDKSCGKRKASDETESRDVEPSKELKPDETFSKEGGDNKEITKASYNNISLICQIYVNMYSLFHGIVALS